MSVKGKHSKMFPQARRPPLTGIYSHRATAFTYYIIYNRDRVGKGTARG